MRVPLPRRVHAANARRTSPAAHPGDRDANPWVELPLGAHTLAESPRWHPGSHELGWVDILAGTLHVAAPLGDGTWSPPRTHSVTGAPTSLEAVPETPSTWDVASSGRLVRLDLTSGRELVSTPVTDRFPEVRTNDTFRDPTGRVLVSLFTEDRVSPHGGIVSIDPHTRTLRTVATGMVTANGLGLNQAATRLYAVDTARGLLVRHHYDLRTGAAGPPVVLVRHPGPGKLDGLLVLADDSVLVAVWDEGALRRYDSEGRLMGVLAAPAARPTSITALPVAVPGGPAPVPGGFVLTTAAERPEEASGGRLYWTGSIR